MSKLATLRSRIAGLRRRRAVLREGTGWFAVGIAVLWVLLAAFLVDWSLETSRTQRVVLWVLGIGAAVWAFLRYAVPHIGRSESDEDVALVVERQHGIDTDLVAAMQFENAEQGNWGSPRLQTAVVDYVAEFSPDLDVYEGLDTRTFSRRGIVLAVTGLLVLAGILLWPDHASAFANRMFLGRAHYPTATRIEAISVNEVPVTPMSPERRERLRELRTGATERQEALVDALGAAAGAARSVSSTSRGVYDSLFGPDEPVANAARELERLEKEIGRLADRTRTGEPADDLSPILRDQRVAARKLDELAVQPELEPIRDALVVARTAAHEAVAAVGRLGPIVPHGTELVVRVDVTGEIPETGTLRLVDLESGAGTEIEFQRDPAGDEPSEDGDTSEKGTLLATLPRFVDAVRYQIRVGDAWTEPNLIAVVPLPIVTVDLQATPPEYAADQVPPAVAGQLQQAVVEGSRLDFELTCSNKRLVSAAVTIDETEYPLEPTDDGRRWTLDPEGTPFEAVREAVRFSIAVEDVDGLSLERPLHGFVRIKPDRPPRITANIKYGLPIALPNATRSLDYRALDDFGLSRIVLSMEIARVDGTTSRDTRVLYDAGPKGPLREIATDHTLDFAPFGLAEGDELKLTFEAHDHRGSADPATTVSEPIAFRIGSEVEVLREMQKLDERAERDLDAIIRRELGIGESP